MIIISKNAQKHFKSLLLSEPIGTQIRIFIVNPGMSNAECGLAFCSEKDIEESDIQLKYDKFFIYVNKNIISYLKNAEIDLIIDKLGSQLTLKAPYANKNNFSQEKDTMFPRKKSSLETRIILFLNKEINPQLLMHGGQVELIEVDKNQTAIIQFNGGCNGCSMIKLTLQETIEKKLLSAFPEIKKISDKTNHSRGKHSFY